MRRNESRRVVGGTWAVAAVLIAAGCGGNPEPDKNLGPEVGRGEMAQIEAAITAQKHTKCDAPNIVPILECVEPLSDGKFKAHFGYKNETGKKAKIDIGPFNKFVPGPADRGQPTKFDTGVHHDVFTVKFDGSPLAWLLAKNNVIASRTSPLCGTQPQCPPSCDDGNPCTADRCDATTEFKCTHTAVMDGMSCSDGNVCNGAEVCQTGVCVQGTTLGCDDNNPCTADSCDPKVGCKHTPVADGTSCPASGACNTAGSCQAGQCQPGPGKDCNDNNPCTADLCDPNTGACTNVAVSDGTSCSDGDACNGAETCKAGVCAPGTTLVCNDNNPCTSDTCAATSGCVFTPVSDGTTCPNPSGCGASGICSQGMCTPGTGPNCDDGNPCTADACAPDGTCTHTAVSDGTSCSDNDACNGAEVCKTGQCQPGTPVVCVAADACHLAGTCDPATGQCSKPTAPNGTSCSDGNSCTRNDACQSGVCISGPAVVCTASDACHTAGTCDPNSGNCSNPPVADGASCADGNACNGAETCKSGACQPGTALNCDDTNPCTANSCDPTSGCTSTPVADGTVCAPATQCQAASTCKAGQCQPGAGLSCDDGNPCTADSCDASGSCTHTPVANGVSCSDGNACNGAEVCMAGQCQAGVPVVCTASDQCHVVGTCDPATGQCSNPAAADGTGCSDGSQCTKGDSCKAGVCVAGAPVICTALDQCHVAGTCDPASGQCSNPAAPDGATCTDGNKCTTTDVCKSGQCVGGTAVVCSASDQCHVAGTCDPASGQCSNPAAADGTTCNDNNNCTQADACKAGTCTGNGLVCTASDQCHVAGTCDPVSGSCSNPAAADGTACTDGNGCTLSDKCVGGACTAGAPLICTADPGCTPGICNPATGVCSAPNCPQCPFQVWAKPYATPLVGNVALDSTGAVYVTGGLAGSIDFGKGPITTHGSSDVYVVKLDPATGLATWSFNYGDDVDQVGVNLTADKAGHVTVIGTYIGSLNLGSGVPPISSSIDSIFIAGFNAATGGALWAKNIDLGGGALLGIATDPTDNGVVVTGFTGAGAAANFGSGPLVSGGGKDVVVAKFASATGALVWAKQYGGTADQLANAVAVDSTGRIFVTGQYSGPLDFGAGPLPTASTASKRIFVARLNDTTGVGTASKSFGTSGQQQSVAITTDAAGNVILGGAITGATVDFGTGPLASAGLQDAFVAKLTGDLTTAVWAKRFGDATTQKTQGLSVDGAGNVVAAGLFQGVVDAAPAGTLTSAGGFDAFAMTLDAATGVPKCAAGAGDASDQAASGLAVDGATGSEYVLGTFISSIGWDGTTPLMGSADSSQTYLVKRK